VAGSCLQKQFLILEDGVGNVYQILVFESADNPNLRDVVDQAFGTVKTHFSLIECGD